MEDQKNADVSSLYDAVLRLATREESARFFDDLCTVREIDALAQRWAVARMLANGETYQTVAGVTGASSATISRVNRCLQFGAGGYREALARMNTGQEE